MIVPSLSIRERDVMNILWDSKKPLTASEICKINTSLSINTVQAVLKKLIKKEFIKIDDIVYSGTVLTRSYTWLMGLDEYTAKSFNEFYKQSKGNRCIANIVSTLLDNEEHEEQIIAELQQMLNERVEKKEP